MTYLQRLWAALLGKPSAYVLHLEARLAQFEKRSAAGKKSHVTRKAKTPGFQIVGGNESF